MLESLVALLQPGLEIAAAFAAAALPCLNLDAASPLSSRNIRGSELSAVWLSVFLALVSATAGVYFIDIGFLDREYLEGLAGFGSIAGGLVLLFILAKRARNSGAIRALVSLSLFALVLPRVFQLLRVALGAIESGSLNTEFLLSFSGILIGFAIAVTYGSLLVKVMSRFTGPVLTIIAVAIVLSISAQQLIGVMQFGFSYGYLPLAPGLLSIVAPLINRYEYFTYAVLLASAGSFLAYLTSRKGQIADENSNPAQRRKEKARARNSIRLAAAMLFTIALSGSLFYGAVFAAHLKKKATELTPAESVKANGEFISIPEAKLKSGDLFRFSYEASDGTNIRFILIHKGSGIYGAGLDYCDICGPAGYYQRGPDVVCKRCDVVISIPTIGVPGGCNPIPLKYEVFKGSVNIPAAEFEAAKKKFR